MEELEKLYIILNEKKELTNHQIRILKVLVIIEMDVMKTRSKTTPRAIKL